MKCVNPFLVRKDGLIKGDRRGSPFFVGCGKCLYCRLQRRKEWCLRMAHENESHSDSCFLTLTYDDEHLPAGGTLVKEDLQKYFKRLRRANVKFRYFAVGEYGELEKRPHYHSIMFGVGFSREKAFVDEGLFYLGVDDLLYSCWQKGHVVAGNVEQDSIRYVAQYVDKKMYGDAALEDLGERIPEFALKSQGLGFEFLRKNAVQIARSGYTSFRGKVSKLPRYYVKKMSEVLDSEEFAKFEYNRWCQSVENEIDNVEKILGYPSMVGAFGFDLHAYEEGLRKAGKRERQNLLSKAQLYKLSKRKKL